MLFVVRPEKSDEVQQIRAVEGAVLESFHASKIPGAMMQDKVMWRVVHEGHERVTTLDDRGSVSPRKYGSKQPGNFYILPLVETMRDGDGVV